MSTPAFTGRAEAETSPEQGAIGRPVKVRITAFGDGYFIVSEAYTKIPAEILVIFHRRLAADIIINDYGQVVGKVRPHHHRR